MERMATLTDHNYQNHPNYKFCVVIRIVSLVEMGEA